MQPHSLVKDGEFSNQKLGGSNTYYKTITSHTQQLVQFIHEQHKKTVNAETKTYFISP